MILVFYSDPCMLCDTELIWFSSKYLFSDDALHYQENDGDLVSMLCSVSVPVYVHFHFQELFIIISLSVV